MKNEIKCGYTYECLCRICGAQFALKTQFAPHVCPRCAVNTVDIEPAIKAAIDILEEGIPFLEETTDYERAAWKVCNEIIRLNCELFEARYAYTNMRDFAKSNGLDTAPNETIAGLPRESSEPANAKGQP